MLLYEDITEFRNKRVCLRRLTHLHTQTYFEPTRMLDFTNWEIAGLAFDVVIVYLLNRWYKSKVKDADFVDKAPTYNIGQELHSALSDAKDNVMPYACVYGVTEPTGTPLKSQYSEVLGVVQRQILVEHKAKRTQGFWTDMKSVVKDHMSECPFVLVNGDRDVTQGVRVELVDVLSAEYLQESLQVTYSHFTPTTDSFLLRSFDRLFGDVSKGYQETEKMLAVGTPVLGIGKLMMEGGKRIILSRPDDSRRHIITTSSRSELIRSLRSDARAVRIVCWLFGITGGVFLAYIIYRNVSRARYTARTRQIMDELRLRRRVAAADNVARDDDASREDTAVTCVVCCSKRRDVLLLECGHLCVCSECALALPSPRHCPVCRQVVDRIVPTYVS